MEEKTISIAAFKKELKRRQLKEKVKSKVDQAMEFVKEHPAESFALATTVGGGLFGLIKRRDRNSAIREQQRLKDEYIYDRSLGTYWKLRRKRTAGENLEIERRRKNGESLGDILASMKLL